MKAAQDAQRRDMTRLISKTTKLTLGVAAFLGAGAVSLFIPPQKSRQSERQTPNKLDAHDATYKKGAWHLYTMKELGDWVHLLTTRASHRNDRVKASKDLYDAENYLAMMQAKLNATKREFGF
jgi:hypothetical protein